METFPTMTERRRDDANLPGGIGMSRLRVYGSVSGDGQAGGSPHVHLISGELYYVLRGSGAVETLTLREGFRRVPLAPGDVFHFGPGTVHRLVNTDGLEILVVMQNAGLPERGDAVLTFPDADLRDPETYLSRARAGSLAEAEARRDRAVEGFGELRRAFDRSPRAGATALRGFHSRAVTLARDRAAAWPPVLEQGAFAETSETERRLGALMRGEGGYLEAAAFALVGGEPEGAPRLGMCGHLWPLPEWQTGSQAE